MKIFYIDVETTGLDCQKHGLIQLSGIIEIDGEEVERVNILSAPFKGELVSKEALTVTGKTIDELRGYNGGRPDSMKLMSVAQALGITVDENMAHDAMYDIIITREIFNLLKTQVAV